MIREETISDLDILDHLEIFNSTVECARILGISQSSCSRRYRALSNQLGLDFDRDENHYSARHNLDVLSGIRQASQRIRARSQQPRICLGWELGDVSSIKLPTKSRLVDYRPMSSWKLLSMLDQRLIDVAVMGLIELKSLLKQPLERLRLARIPISQTIMAIPMCRWQYKLLAREDHALQTRNGITAEELRQYPSPALPLGAAPNMMAALQANGLATQQILLRTHSSEEWEGFARDGQGLSYAAPHLLSDLYLKWKLKPIAYSLDIEECLAVVGHRDVLAEPGFTECAQKLIRAIKTSIKSPGGDQHWI